MVPGEEAIRALTSEVTVVVPVWNRADLLAQIAHHHFAPRRLQPGEVIVVDNGSTDMLPL